MKEAPQHFDFAENDNYVEYRPAYPFPLHIPTASRHIANIVKPGMK